MDPHMINHCTFNQLAKEFEGKFECLAENTEKYIPFSVPIHKEFQLDNGKTITHKLNFIYSFRLPSTSLSSLVDNLSERLHNDKSTDCKYKLDDISFKDNQLIFRCFECEKIIRKT